MLLGVVVKRRSTLNQLNVSCNTHEVAVSLTYAACVNTLVHAIVKFQGIHVAPLSGAYERRLLIV
jgi:hypothetical protein